MPSPKMKEFNDSVPKPTMIMVAVGDANIEKQMKRHHKKTSSGRTYLDLTKTKGAFGNKPVKTIPIGYDGIFPKKVKVNVQN